MSAVYYWVKIISCTTVYTVREHVWQKITRPIVCICNCLYIEMHWKSEGVNCALKIR